MTETDDRVEHSGAVQGPLSGPFFVRQSPMRTNRGLRTFAPRRPTAILNMPLWCRRACIDSRIEELKGRLQKLEAVRAALSDEHIGADLAEILAPAPSDEPPRRTGKSELVETLRAWFASRNNEWATFAQAKAARSSFVSRPSTQPRTEMAMIKTEKRPSDRSGRHWASSEAP